MKEYRVNVFHHAIWNRLPPETVSAISAADAARRVCGFDVRDVGGLHDLCARVWRVGGLPVKMETFYAA